LSQSADTALQNLCLPQHSEILNVFGRVLRARAKWREPSCAILDMLERKDRILELLNEDCAVYISQIGLVDARKKCEHDVLGQVKQPAKKFNGICGDFWSEMAAIRELAKNGFHKFRAIASGKAAQTACDYEAYFHSEPADIEVKNIRSSPTVLDIFDECIRENFRSEPSEYAFNIQVEYPYDSRATPQQVRAIRSYVASLRGRTPPFNDDLDLGEASARTHVIAGLGTTFLTRAIGLDSPEPLRKDKFLAKIHEKAVEALAQMKNKQRVRALVINVDSPSGSIPEEFIRAAQDVVSLAFRGEVKPFILHYRYLVSEHESQ
jgi:hypothetical protein